MMVKAQHKVGNGGKC